MQQKLQDRIIVNISWCRSTDEMLNEKYDPYWYLYAESDGQGIKSHIT
jgi:hypothetical protein